MNVLYREGFKNGGADAGLGVRSEYSWFGINDISCYIHEYSRGYRAGWLAHERPKP